MTVRLATGVAAFALAVVATVPSSGLALAATVSNVGDASVVLVIVEDGNKVEVSVDAGTSEIICSAGCFVTLPNGDRIGLAGDETLEVQDGEFVIK